MSCTPDQSSVIYRTGLADRDYDEAIEALEAAKQQPGNESSGCTVCCSSGHTAEHCHHNPLVMARRAVLACRVWRCFHCDEVFTDPEAAQAHFGAFGSAAAKCASDLADLKLELKEQQRLAAEHHETATVFMNQVKRLQAALYQIEKHPTQPDPFARAVEMRDLATEALTEALKPKRTEATR